MSVTAHTCTAEHPLDAPRASQTAVARSGGRYAIRCHECGNWFIAHTRAQRYCHYCGEMRRIESRISSRRWAWAHRQLHKRAVAQGLAYD